MRFYAKASNYRVQIRPGGLRPDPDTPGIYTEVPGDYAQFDKGQFEAHDEAVIAKLRSHQNYGYGRSFWAEVDRPPNVTAEEEMAKLRAEVAAYRRIHGAQVVVVDRPVQTGEGETGLARLNRLKKATAEAGITPEKTWKVEDYENALAQMKEG